MVKHQPVEGAEKHAYSDDDHLAIERTAAARASRGSSSNRIHDVAFAEVARESRGGVVLDFGAGRGDFAARLLASASFERVVAADLVRYSDLPPGVDWVDADLNEPLPLPTSSCDVIVSIEVVEHLENLRAVCREWYRLLRPGGCLVVTTPNNESLRAILSLIFRGHFVAFVGSSYPAHITAVVRADLTRALRETGFQSIEFFTTGEGAIPRVTSLTWQRISGGRLRGLRFSDNVGLVARRPQD